MPFSLLLLHLPGDRGRPEEHRPGELVAEEFQQLHRLGARYVFLDDSVFNSTPDHVARVCEALVRRKPAALGLLPGPSTSPRN